MRSSSELIDELVGDLSPAPRAYIALRFALGVGCGAVVAAATTLAMWGLRPDLGTAVTSWPFWMKAAFTGSLAAAGVAGAARLARPGARARGAALAALLTVAVLAASAALQLAQSAEGASRRLLMGSTAASCPWLIMLISVPILTGGLWAMRLMAPTRLTQAGATVGLAAGSLAALVYAMSCDESAAPFVLAWYGLGIAVPTLIGAMLGPRVLRW